MLTPSSFRIVSREAIRSKSDPISVASMAQGENGVFAYYLELAVRSLRRSPGLTALMILAIGFGVAASMTMYSVFRGVSADPIPWKSSQLFVPQSMHGGRATANMASRPLR